MKVTQQTRLTEALLNGEQLTVPQMAARFDIANPTSVISNIRFAGYAVYANPRKAGNGVQVTEYRHGEASRKMVALAYKAQAMGITL